MSVTIRPRSSWTTTPFAWPSYPGRLFDKARVTYLAPHYPAVAGTIGVLTAAQEEGWLRTIRQWHVEGNGWADIGYAMVVCQSGRAYMAGGITHSTAHAGTANPTAVGVLFLLGNGETPSAAAIATFNAIGPWLRDTQGFTAMTTVRDHGRLPGQATSCAGRHIRAAVDDGTLTLTTPEETPMKRRPTRTDMARLETRLRDRGFDVYDGPSYVDRGFCYPGAKNHNHNATSRHFKKLAVDVGYGAPAINDLEALLMELLGAELLADPDVAWRPIFNRGPGDHEDHMHIDDDLAYPVLVRPRPGVRARDGLDLFVPPRIFPDHVPSSNRGYTLAAIAHAQTLLVRAGYPAGGADGYLGTRTRAAAEQAQRTLGLTVDGIPGPDTVAALERALAKPPTPPAPTPEPEPEPAEPAPALPADARIAGSDRYATSAAAYRAAPATLQQVVYLAAGNAVTLADALSAPPDGCVLLVRAGQHTLPGPVAAALADVRPTTVRALGSDQLVTDPALAAAYAAAGIPT